MTNKRIRFWKSLPPEDKEGVVRTLLERGYTCEAVGKALGTTKNAVVGYQHNHLPELTGRMQGEHDVVPPDVLQELLGMVWPKDEAASEATAPDIRQVSTKLAINEARQCHHSDGCAYETLPGRKDCGRPGHNK